MKHLPRLLLLAAAIALGVWGWIYFHPSPEKVIRNRLVQLAKLGSFSPTDGNVTRVANIQRLGTFFADEVQVMVNVPGLDSHTFNRREEITSAAMAARSVTTGLKVEFPDIHVTVDPDNQSASADVTLAARPSDQKDLIIQELKFTFKNIEKTWLITGVETVKTLR